jgi:hypothetical protein
MKKVFLIVLLILLGLTATACFDIHVRECATFPADRFDAAMERIGRVEKSSHGRGQPHELRLLIYDGDDRELVELGIPFGMLKDMKIDDDDEWNRHGGGCLKRHVKNPELRLEELKKRGPGLVMQVDDEEENSHILIWLE